MPPVNSKKKATAAKITASASVASVLLGLAGTGPAAAENNSTQPPTVASSAKKTLEDVKGEHGDVVSIEMSEKEAFKKNPNVDVKPSVGGNNPGAIMGQSLREDKTDKGYTSDSSLELLQTIAGATPDETLAENITEKVAEETKARAGAAGNPEGGAAALSTWRPSGIQGMDVSGWQPVVNWSQEYRNGARFAYVKSTEGTYYKSEAFADQYAGSYNSGMIRGSYHFAYPEVNTGAAQADYFVNNGGGWSADGKTLPGLLDVEHNPYGQMCYNMNQAQMRTWIQQFSDRYKQRTGRLPAIYSTTNWWKTCTGNTTIFNDHPLHIAAFNNVGAGELFQGRTNYDIWQYSESGPFAGDSNRFAGSAAKLTDLAKNKNYHPIGGKAPAGATTTAPKPAPAPSYPVYGAIAAKWKALGGEAGIGAPTGNETKANGGFYQSFKKGNTTTTIHWTSSTGAHEIVHSGDIYAKWKATGGINGYGWPMGAKKKINGGYLQNFKNGSKITKVFWSPSTGAQPVVDTSGIGGKFRANGYEVGLGWPTAPETSANGVATQTFKKTNGETNIIYWKSGMPTSIVKTTGVIGKHWVSKGSLNGLGYPTTDEKSFGDGTTSQSFKKGSTTTTVSTKNGKLVAGAGTAPAPAPAPAADPKEPVSGNYTVKGGIAGKYKQLGGESKLGKPTMNEKGDGKGGVYQEFVKDGKKTILYWTAKYGTHKIETWTGIGAHWVANDSSDGFGQPTNSAVSIPGKGWYQTFVKDGEITKVLWSSATGTHAVNESGGIGSKWKQNGYENGFGFPTTEERKTDDGGAYQVFKNGGAIYKVMWSSATGTHAVKESGAIGGKWKDAGFEKGYGYPTGYEKSEGNGVVSQTFKKGGESTTVFWKSGEKTNAIKTTGGIGNKWKSSGGLNGYGYPTTDEVGRGDGVISQTFKKGTTSTTVYWKSGKPTIAMTEAGDIFKKWQSKGGLSGYGYPITDKIHKSGKYYQKFQKGNDVWNVQWVSGSGARAIKESSGIGKEWVSAGREGGTYGYVTSDEVSSGTGAYQTFSNGYTIHWDNATNTGRITKK